MSYSNSQPISYNFQRFNSLKEFDDVIAGLKEELEKVTTLRNGYAPINRRLPAEILCEIFVQLARECHNRYTLHSKFFFHNNTTTKKPNPHAWVTVTHVCRQWRNIALNSSSLWTSIYDKQPGYLRAFIARSRQAPLDIKEHYNDHKHAHGVLSDLLRERDRWRTFECTVPILGWNDIDNAPQLEELRLCDPFRTPFAFEPSPASFEFPRLRRVTVDSAPFGFVKNLVKRDTITKLYLAHLNPLQSLATWLDVLSLLPSLEELALVRVIQSSPHIRPPPLSSSRRISFPKLQHLQLVGRDDGRAASTFLDAITIPSTTRLTLESIIPFAGHEYLRRLLETICGRFADRTSAAESPREILACRVVCPALPFQSSALSIEIWTTPISMQVLSSRERGPKPEISMEWDTAHIGAADVRRTAEIVVDTLPLSKLRLLCVSGLLSAVFEPQHLSKFRSVRELCMDYTAVSCLTTPGAEEAALLCPSVDEEAPVPFPKLEHLALQSVQWYKHPSARPGTCTDSIVYDIRGVLHQRKAVGLSLKSLNLFNGVNIHETEAEALVWEGLVDTVEECDSGVSSECPTCSMVGGGEEEEDDDIMIG